jgi:hypothetical protein
VKRIPYTCAKFVVFEKVNEAVYSVVDKSKTSNGMQTVYNLGSGLIAGFAAAIISQPADTMLSKINKTKGEPGEGTTSRLIKIAKELGLRGSYSGIGARLFMVGTLTAGQFAIYGKSSTLLARITSNANGIVKATSRRPWARLEVLRSPRPTKWSSGGSGAMIPRQPRHWVSRGRLCSARKSLSFLHMAGMDISHFLFMCLRFICRLATCTFSPPEVALVTVRFDEISCTIDGALNDTMASSERSADVTIDTRCGTLITGQPAAAEGHPSSMLVQHADTASATFRAASLKVKGSQFTSGGGRAKGRRMLTSAKEGSRQRRPSDEENPICGARRRSASASALLVAGSMELFRDGRFLDVATCVRWLRPR